jgi:hypothetical protein
MRLGEKQELFACLVPMLLNYAHFLGYEVRIGEVYRSPEEARRLAKLGKGIVKSNHCKKIAIDLILTKDGNVCWDQADYEDLGSYWKSRHELCRWGGDFKRRDAFHFSLEHNGVM